MAESERRKLLNESLKKINKDSKRNLVKLGNDPLDAEKIPFGIPLLDEFLGGGSKAGTFTVIYGAESTGKSTLTLQAIANAQKLGKICCYIDLEHSYDKKRATELGVKIEELVLVDDCTTAEEALEIVRTLCQDKVVDLFVIDSVQAMSPKNEQQNKTQQRKLEEREIAELARTLSKFFKVVSPDVFRAKASVLLIGQVRIGGIGTFFTRATMSGGEAIKHWASTRIFMRRGQTKDAPMEKSKETFEDPDGKEHYRTVKKQIGFDCVFKLEKTKSSDSATEGSDLHIPFYYNLGFISNYVFEKLRKQYDDGLITKEEILNYVNIDLNKERIKLEETEPTAIPPTLKGLKTRKFTKEESKLLDKDPKPRKRGRPKKEKNDT